MTERNIYKPYSPSISMEQYLKELPLKLFFVLSSGYLFSFFIIDMVGGYPNSNYIRDGILLLASMILLALSFVHWGKRKEVELNTGDFNEEQ